MSSSEGVPGKLQQRLETAVSERKFYEAHQLYKSIYFRLVTRRNFSDALKSILSGAEFLLDNEQWESGTDLSCLVLEAYIKSGLELNESHLNQLCELLRRMTVPGTERSAFIKKTLYILKCNQLLLHGFNEYLGRKFWHEGASESARTFILQTGNGYMTGRFLIELHQRCGFRSEVDLFITQAVLQLLCMRQPSVAALAYHTYTRGHPKLEPGPPFTRFPLLNFIWLLMLAIQKQYALSVFSVLCEKYAYSLARDMYFAHYLDKISQMYFGVKPVSSHTTSFLSHLARFLNPNPAGITTLNWSVGSSDRQQQQQSVNPSERSMQADEID